MSDKIKHRGPDDFGYYIGNFINKEYKSGHLTEEDFSHFNSDWNVAFGHRRLSIIDLSEKASQPMSNEDNTIWIIYNGEIYNHINLRENLLEKGHIFKSQSDTEVIIHAYEEWGEDCIKKFNGMWAFAIWNSNNNTLFCSRDRFGVKPFYYYYTNTEFIFASEIKAILEALPIKPEPNYDVIYKYLMHGRLCDDNKTFFKNIYRLEPAHSVSLSYNKFEIFRYWNYNYKSHQYDYSNPEKTFYNLFKNSIKLRLRSDVPIGVTLSGGLDSTSIVAFYSMILNSTKIKTFSAIFKGFEYDESKFMEIVERKYNINPTYIEPVQYNYIDELKKIIWYMDYPSLSLSVFPLWKIMQEINKNNIKVILDGQGADESLAGYIDKYLFTYYIDIMSDRHLSLPIKIKKIVYDLKINYKRYGIKPILWLFRKSIPNSHNIYKNFLSINSVLSKNFKEKIDFKYQQKIAKNNTNTNKLKSNLLTELYSDHSKEILPYLLKYNDAISMAFSIESRLPFLDYRLVEFIFGLSYDQIINESYSKYIMRKSFEDILPHEILYRNKIGFATPISKWYKENMDTVIKPILFSSKSIQRKIYNFEELDKLLKKHIQGKIDISNYIYRWISLELWFRLYIDNDTS